MVSGKLHKFNLHGRIVVIRNTWLLVLLVIIGTSLSVTIHNTCIVCEDWIQEWQSCCLKTYHITCGAIWWQSILANSSHLLLLLMSEKVGEFFTL